MCTLSLIVQPGGNDFLLAMNRDELLTRAEALPPAIFEHHGMRAVYPYETGKGTAIEAGLGTWIGANETGVAMALLNWSIPSPRVRRRQSRGTIIPALLATRSSRAASALLRAMELSAVPPFRLVGVFATEATICEWRWNGETLRKISKPWRSQNWFSSSLGDERAAAGRSAIVQLFAGRRDAESVAWLRRLHRAHGAEAGPHSICVHRADAASVSYTELRWDARGVRCFYQPGQPCQTAGQNHTKLLRKTA